MEAIVDRYENRIFTFGLKMCGQLQDAEDITQDTFLNAFKYLNGFREETKLKNWLFKIAATACIRKRRKKKCEPDYELSLESFMDKDGVTETYEIPDGSDDPSNNVLQAEMKAVINDAIRGRQLEQHLKQCPECRNCFDALKKTVTLCKKNNREEIPGEMQERLRMKLRDCFDRRLPPDQ